MTDHPFATVDILAGEVIGSLNTEMRPVPDGLFEVPEVGASALTDIPAGTPILQSNSGPQSLILPSGWWIVSTEVPDGAQVGDRVRVVLIDQGRDVEGVVSSTGDWDGLTMSPGAVAVSPSEATEVAMAAAEGRLRVLVSTD